MQRLVSIVRAGYCANLRAQSRFWDRRPAAIIAEYQQIEALLQSFADGQLVPAQRPLLGSILDVVQGHTELVNRNLEDELQLQLRQNLQSYGERLEGLLKEQPLRLPPLSLTLVQPYQPLDEAMQVRAYRGIAQMWGDCSAEGWIEGYQAISLQLFGCADYAELIREQLAAERGSEAQRRLINQAQQNLQ